METEPRHFWIGFATLMTIGLVVACVAWYIGNSNEQNQRLYRVYFHEQSVTGLQIGSPITIRGIRVGEVTAIEITKQQEFGAKVDIKIAKEIPVNSHNRAIIERNLLTGLGSIELRTIEMDRPPESPAKEKGVFLIQEGEGDVQKIKGSLSEAISNMNMTLAGLQKLLDTSNQERLSQSMKNVEKITENLKTEAKTVSKVLNKLDKLLANSTLLVATVGETSKTIARETVLISRNLRSTSDRIAATVEEYKDPGKIISGPSRIELGPGENR